jgi:phosphoesterase RecJ-like protein
MHIIKATYPSKNVIITGEISDFVSFIGAPTLLEDESLFENALSICVDCATSERLSDTRYNKAKYSIKIDHHIDVEKYGNYQYVDTTAPACAQIITEFYLKFKDELIMNKEAATALYVGISTDTGRFKFDSVNSRTFMAAAALVDFGVDLGYIDNQLSVETLQTLKLKGYCLSNFKMTENGFAYIIMKRDTINEFGVSDEDAAAQVSTISTIEGCPVWAIFMEYPTEIRIRLRSRGPVINLLAEEYGGGGHAKASGARLNDWTQLDEFVKNADTLVKKYKESL